MKPSNTKSEIEVIVHSKMGRISYLLYSVCLLQAALAVKVKVMVHSDQEDSKMEEEEAPRAEPSWPEHKKRSDADVAMPFIKSHKRHEEKQIDFEEEKTTTTKTKLQHPNELIFPLIYRQSHVNSMFKFGDNWYTWSTEKRSDGSKGINYYICYDEPKRCDEIGWVRLLIVKSS